MGIKSVKTKLFFSNEYYSCKPNFFASFGLVNDTKKKSQADDKNPGGLSQEQLKQAATTSHFEPLKNRIKKISSMVRDIISHQ